VVTHDLRFFTDFGSRLARRLSGGFTRRYSEGPGRRYFYPPSLWRTVLGKSGC